MSRASVDDVNKTAAATPDAIFEAIHQVTHLFRAEQYRTLRDGPSEITHLEGKLLGFFARNPAATLSDLVAHFGRDKGQLARLIKNLKEQGLLAASSDQTDRRTVRLSLTAEGRAVQQTLRRQTDRVAKLAVRQLSAREQEQLIALLQKVRANLEAK